MKKVKCVNGHFFDLDRFAACPTCGSGVGAVSAKPGPKSQKPVSQNLISKKLSGKGNDVTEMLPESEQPATNAGTGKAGGIIWNFKSQNKETGESEKPKSDVQEIPETVMQTNGAVEVHMAAQPPVSQKPANETGSVSGKQPATSLTQAVANTGHGTVSALPKTVAYYEQFTETVPPTGWLVCVRGAHKGQAFQCKVNKNRIGRNEAYDIPLVYEQTVNREVHATLIFDPKNCKFYLHDGEGDGLVYVNDQPLFSYAELKAYDKIQLGKAEFVFIPLCSERFSWDNYSD